jgi:hypothetical protein
MHMSVRISTLRLLVISGLTFIVKVKSSTKRHDSDIQCRAKRAAWYLIIRTSVLSCQFPLLRKAVR